jgi:hypothetical protein
VQKLLKKQTNASTPTQIKCHCKEEKNIEERQQEIIFNFGEKLLKHYIKTDTVHKPF